MKWRYILKRTTVGATYWKKMATAVLRATLHSDCCSERNSAINDKTYIIACLQYLSHYKQQKRDKK